MEMALASSEDVERAAGAGVALVPFGSLEQHCRAPLGTDSIIVWEVSRRACSIIERRKPCLLHPLIPVGYSPEWLGAPGTVSLRLETMAMLVEDVLESLYRSGLRRIALVNGHGGNSTILEAAARGWASRRREAVVVVADYWRPAGLRLGHCSSAEEALLREAGVAAECSCWRRAESVESVRAIRVPPMPYGVGMPGGPPASLDSIAGRLAEALMRAFEAGGEMLL